MKIHFESTSVFRAVVQKCIGPAGRGDINLKTAGGHLVCHLEKADEVRLPGPVCPDEDVERTQVDSCVADRFPPGKSKAGQLSHVTVSLFSRWPRSWSILS